MKARIRVGVLLFKDDKILLIKHVNPKDGFTWWVAPGGGVDGAESIFDAAKRECHEEAGLIVEPENVVYLRQYISEESQQNNMDAYIAAKIINGKETTENIYGKGDDDKFIKELRYFSEEEIKHITVFPKILQHEMWQDKKNGFSSMKFIGVEKDKE